MAPRLRTVSRLLPVPAPFDFELTAGHQTFFRGRTGADYYHDGAYRRVLDRGDRLVLATVRPASAGLAVDLAAPALDAATVDWAIEQIAWIFALDADLTPLLAAAATDPLVAALIARFPGLRPARVPAVFEALVQAIVGQQISGLAARRIRDRLVDTHGEPFADGATTWRAFPRPAAIAATSIDDLRALPLTGRKAEYLRGIAAEAAAGRLDLDALRALDDAAAIAALTALRGVGRWTAEWVLIRALGRPDGFPAGDLALARVLERFYPDRRPIDPRRIDAIGDRWRGFRGLVTSYLFAAIRQNIAIDPPASDPPRSKACNAAFIGNPPP